MAKLALATNHTSVRGATRFCSELATHQHFLALALRTQIKCLAFVVQLFFKVSLQRPFLEEVFGLVSFRNPFCKQLGSVCYKGRSLVVEQRGGILNSKLTDGAGFPPFAVQTRVKFWAWYRLNGAGVFSATTDMLLGGAVETENKNGQEEMPKVLMDKKM